MYSKAKIAGHPIHPMLVAFPIAFYVASCAAYIIYSAGSDPFWFQVGYIANAAGVITALLAAVPGFIDWAFGIPGGTAAKSTGFIHMALNVIVVVLFAVCGWLNANQYGVPAPHPRGILVLPIVGVVLTIISGFLGWKLIATHHVGVDLTPEQERIDPATAQHRASRQHYLDAG
jgi:uncharacterized membrane protein